MIFEPVTPFLASAYHIKFATAEWERRGAEELRRQVFCLEQNLFDGDDRDKVDDVAIPIVALSMFGVAADAVVGTVRIHEAETGLWWGSRLAVTRDYRRSAMLGTALIKLAVSSAHARGCTRFLAHVQSQNAPLFHRLNWHTLDVLNLHGKEHHKMEADLAAYPPFGTPEIGFQALSRQVA
jgi:putative N-acetyltransferase (TIGR04045 family)